MHRTANVNEYSTRYSEAIDSQATTRPGDWRMQNPDNKQGSSGVVPAQQRLTTAEKTFHEQAKQLYKERLHLGVAREQARKDLPLSTYTEAYWKVDLRNLLHFLQLRLDAHAQLEIREYARTIAKIVRAWVPATWSAFEDYQLQSYTFSGPEVDVLVELIAQLTDHDVMEPDRRKLFLDRALPNASKRERGEFLRVLGLL